MREICEGVFMRPPHVARRGRKGTGHRDTSGCDTVSLEASVDPTESSEAGMAP